jgi:hypothetical protein
MHHLLQDMSDESEEIERKRTTEHESEENIYTIVTLLDFSTSRRRI